MGMNERELELLTQYESDLIRTLDLSYLMPYLTKSRLLSSNDADALTKSELTRQDSIKKFLSILKTKGQTAFSLFMNALRDEKEHLGHASLHRMLSNANPDGYAHDWLYTREPSTTRMREPRPSTGMTHSLSGHSLCSCSGSEVSHFSPLGSSAGASSIGSEALSNGLASVQSELSSIKNQIADNSKKVTDNFKMMGELTNELKKVNTALQKTSPSRNDSTLPRRRPSLARLGKFNSFSQSFDSFKQNTKPSTKRAQSTAAHPAPIQITKMVSFNIANYNAW